MYQVNVIFKFRKNDEFILVYNITQTPQIS